MPKRVLLPACAAVVLLSSASWAQKPGVPESAPTFRDILRGRVGQECRARVENGLWTLSFPAHGGALGARAWTLVGVGQDFVQLREPNRNQRFVPLVRVDVVFWSMTLGEDGGQVPAVQEVADRPWTRYRIASVDELFDPRTETEPASWPDYVTAEERAEVTALIDGMERGGREGLNAKKRLVELGHKSLTGIVNRLREVDYTDSFETFFAYELNKVLEKVTITINAGFQEVELGSTVDLRIAHWNAQTVKAWLRLLAMYPTKADWDRLMASIKARRDRQP